MLDKQLLEEIFKSSMIKASEILNKPPHSITRTEYRETRKKYPYISKISTDNFKCLGGFRNARNKYFQNTGTINTPPDTKDDIKVKFIEYLTKFKKIPKQFEFLKFSNISRYEFLKHYSSIKELYSMSISEKSEINFKLLDEYTVKVSDVDKASELKVKFTEYLMQFKKIPNMSELVIFSGESKYVFTKYYKSIDALYRKCVSENPELGLVVLNETSFTSKYYSELREKIKGYRRFIITTAVSNKKVDVNLLNSLKNYANRNDALILVLPCQDVVNRKTEFEWNLDPKLHDCGVIFKDTYLNKNLFISDIKISAKQIKPTTGLGRFVPNRGSIILAGTKYFLEFIPNAKDKQPRCIMTTGALTVNDYNSEYYMSKRLSKIAENDHTLGAIVVELEDDDIFHFRQLQANSIGSVSDLGIEYNSDGSIDDLTDTVAVLGDIHCGKQDSDADKVQRELLSTLKVKDVILHDVFDCNSVNHHHVGKIAHCANKNRIGSSGLEKEGIQLARYLDMLSNHVKGGIVIVESNHNLALGRYLEEARWVKDSENLYYSLDLMKEYMDGNNPLKFMVESKIGLAEGTKVKWLDLDEDYYVHGVQCGKHGHLGANGSFGNASTFEKAYEKTITGHRHSASINRSVFVVGASNFDMQYNKGLSSWTITLALIYSNGCRQLINCIKRKDGTYSCRL